MDCELPSVRAIVESLSQRTASGGEASRRPRRSRHPVNPLEAQPLVASGWRPLTFQGPVLLDVGCDMGGFARAVAKTKRFLVVALELRATAVAFAKARAKEEGLETCIFLRGNANVDMERILKDLRHQVGCILLH